MAAQVLEGESTTNPPCAKRPELLETLDLGGGFWLLPPVFDDEPALFSAVCEQGLEGIVAKRRDSLYRPGERGWTKVKSRAYLAVRRGARPRESPGASFSID
jgi:bifunctional non-homologous end joining protein LigD